MLETIALISITCIGISFFLDLIMFFVEKYQERKEKREYLKMCSVPTKTTTKKKGKK